MLRPALLSSSLLLSAVAAARDDGLPPVAPAPTPVGFAIDESGCASGGPTYYFFAGGKVVVDDCGDDCPIVNEGTWTLAEQQLTVWLTTAFVGKGSTPVLAASDTVYESYAGAVVDRPRTDTMLWTGTEGCTVVKAHTLKVPTARAWLKGGFQGDYGFLSDRPVTPGDLKGKDKLDLVRMRNEVFAAYGHTFKTEALAKHFATKPGYRPRFSDVTAFLTPLEQKNVATIKAAETAVKEP